MPPIVVNRGGAIETDLGRGGVHEVQFSDQTEEDLERLVASDFGPAKQNDDLRRRALTWLLFKARCVPTVRRTVRHSARVMLRHEHAKSIGHISERLREGLDVTPWLSSRIRKRPDNLKADQLFNDWQISHFHLKTLLRNHRDAFKSEALLFAFITAGQAVILDILPHGKPTWTELQLLRSLRDTAPEILESFRFKGTLSPPGNTTPEDLARAREHGLNIPIVIDGQSYMAPGMGLTASRHPLRIVRASDEIQRALREIHQKLAANDVSHPAVRQIVSQIGSPIRLGIRFDAGRLIICEHFRRVDLFTGRCVC